MLCVTQHSMKRISKRDQITMMMIYVDCPEERHFKEGLGCCVLILSLRSNFVSQYIVHNKCWCFRCNAVFIPSSVHSADRKAKHSRPPSGSESKLFSAQRTPQCLSTGGGRTPEYLNLEESVMVLV